MSDAPPVHAARFVGQRIPRKEDRRLLTGQGSYTDDIVLAGMLEAAFVRSIVARGAIVRIDVAAARALPGVRAVYTAEDMKKLPVEFMLLYSSGAPTPPMTPLAADRVCYVGDPVALVVADNRYIAEDAAALVEVDYAPSDPVVTIAQARAASPVHPSLGPTNIAHEAATPDDPEIEAIFQRAAHVVVGTIKHQRQAHVPMEGRAVVAAPQGKRELTVYLSCQSPHMAARYISMAFSLPDHSVRVISKDVGGAFGLKVQPFREEVAVIAAALLIGRPVKWIEDRLENLTTASQAREQEVTVKLALDKDARLLGADLDYECNLGAYPHGLDSNGLGMMMFPGPYHLPKLKFRARAYFSNTCGQAAYRGPWMIESLARETMLDVAARQIGIDPIELRRRNLITREEQPHQMITGPVLDRVTPRETLDLALKTLDLAAFRAEQTAARAQGRHLGLGVAVYVEPTTMAMGGVLSTEMAQVRIDPTGQVVAVLSTHSQGHGTQTTMSQVIADQLGVDIEDVTVFEDDSSRGGFGAGAGGSRQAVAGGGAARKATDILSAKIRAIAAHVLNANPDDIRVDRGVVSVAGVAEVTTTLKDIAAIAYLDTERLPAGMEPGLEAQYRYRPPPIVFSNASHICVCEVDAETGLVTILRWIASEDCGVMINPAIVEGQIAGGVVQAIGGVMMEHATYDDAGNPTAATFKDYIIPAAQNIPQIEYCHLQTASESEGGFKGVGEGGAIIGPPTMVNAVADALAPFGVRCLDLPLSPSKLVKLMAEARAGAPG